MRWLEFKGAPGRNSLMTVRHDLFYGSMKNFHLKINWFQKVMRFGVSYLAESCIWMYWRSLFSFRENKEYFIYTNLKWQKLLPKKCITSFGGCKSLKSIDLMKYDTYESTKSLWSFLLVLSQSLLSLKVLNEIHHGFFEFFKILKCITGLKNKMHICLFLSCVTVYAATYIKCIQVYNFTNARNLHQIYTK